MTIETQRLLLRPFRTGDAEDVLEYLRDPASDCFADMRLCSLEEARSDMENRAEDGEYYLAIERKEDGKVIGEIFAFPESPLPDPDGVKYTYSPCWMLRPDCFGKGYAYEAAHAFVDYLFREKGARRVYAQTADFNTASRRLCEKLGMRLEGLFPEYVSFVKGADGEPVYEDTVQYAILRKEWMEKR